MADMNNSLTTNNSNFADLRIVVSAAYDFYYGL